MKNNVITFILTLFSFLSFAQVIFPNDIGKVITDENLSESKILKFNDFYISNLGFKRVNDTLYFDNVKKESLSLTSFKKGNKIYSVVDYLTIANHWNDFEKELKDFEITKLKANTFTAVNKDYNDYKIELLENGIINNQKVKHIRFSFAYEKKVKSEKPTFPIVKEYPFHYTVWYFDVKLITEEKDTYYPTIILTKEKTKNKIEFLDKKSILISYVDENNILLKSQGTYMSSENAIVGTHIYKQVDGPSIYLELENSHLIKDKLYMGKTIHFSKLSKKEFLEFIFNMYFNINKNDKGFILKSKIELNRPALEEIIE